VVTQNDIDNLVWQYDIHAHYTVSAVTQEGMVAWMKGSLQAWSDNWPYRRHLRDVSPLKGKALDEAKKKFEKEQKISDKRYKEESKKRGVEYRDRALPEHQLDLFRRCGYRRRAWLNYYDVHVILPLKDVVTQLPASLIMEYCKGSWPLPIIPNSEPPHAEQHETSCTVM
jgi:hypothetical protein